MFGKRQSYAEAVQGRRRTARRLGALLLVFISYELLSGFIFTNYTAKSRSMAPTLLPGERLIATPLAFGPRTLFGKLPGFSRPARGDIVVVEPNYVRRLGFWELLSDSLVRFATFQLVSPARNGRSHGGQDGMLASPALLRVVGLPGDTLRMEDFVFMVKASGTDQFLTEFELSSSRYDISHDDAPAGWRDDLPGSGRMADRLLGADEYFLAGDARSSSSDSRLWGPIRLDRFSAKAMLRYWPPKRFGAP